MDLELRFREGREVGTTSGDWKISGFRIRYRGCSVSTTNNGADLMPDASYEGVLM